VSSSISSRAAVAGPRRRDLTPHWKQRGNGVARPWLPGTGQTDGVCTVPGGHLGNVGLRVIEDEAEGAED